MAFAALLLIVSYLGFIKDYVDQQEIKIIASWSFL